MKESCVVFPEKGVGSILGKLSLHNGLAVSRKIEFAMTHLSPKSSYLGLGHGQSGVSGWGCPDCRAAGTFAGLWGLAIYLQFSNCSKMPWGKNAELPKHQGLPHLKVLPQLWAGGH